MKEQECIEIWLGDVTLFNPNGSEKITLKDRTILNIPEIHYDKGFIHRCLKEINPPGERKKLLIDKTTGLIKMKFLYRKFLTHTTYTYEEWKKKNQL